MSPAITRLLHEFDQLSPDEKREFSAAIINRTVDVNYGEISDEELTASASRLFQMFDEGGMPKLGEGRMKEAPLGR